MRRANALTLVIAVAAFGVAGCGGDDAPDPAAPAPPAETRAQQEAQNAALLEQHRTEQAPQKPTEEEMKVERTATSFYGILATDEGGSNRTTIDTTSFCDLMSEAARGQTIRYAKVSSGIAQEWTCEDAVALLVLRSKRMGAFEGLRHAEVIGVNTEGDRATATVRFGKGPATSIGLVREDGEWKLAASSLGH